MDADDRFTGGGRRRLWDIDPRELLRLVEAALGPKVSGLPTDLNSGPIARVAAFFAADLPDVAFDDKDGWTGIDFTAG